MRYNFKLLSVCQLVGTNNVRFSSIISFFLRSSFGEKVSPEVSDSTSFFLAFSARSSYFFISLSNNIIHIIQFKVKYRANINKFRKEELMMINYLRCRPPTPP